MANWATRLFSALLFALLLLSLGVVLAPEPPARAIEGLKVRVIHGVPGVVAVGALSDLDTSAPDSVLKGAGAELRRSWTENGAQSLEMEIGPLPAFPYIGVTYQGYVRDRDGLNGLYLRCPENGQTRMVSTGATHTTLLQVVTPVGSWCPAGPVYLRVKADSISDNLGVVVPVEVAKISYLKRSYIGLAAYFLCAFSVVLAAFFGGGLLAARYNQALDPVVAGLLAIGSTGLTLFYLYASTPVPAPAGGVILLAVALGLLALTRRWPRLAADVWHAQRGPVAAWFMVAFTAFTVLHLGSTGSGGWEPNFRFAPATWSSDHTLPATFAEAARVGQLQQDGRLGDWSLSDRPPLMAGAYLMFADLFAALQVNNDGPHLQPIVLGVGGIVLCALWAAIFYWGARGFANLEARTARLALVVVAITPFAIFNTFYTWPKLLAAAFSLAAAVLVLKPKAHPPNLTEACAFGALAAFAILSHSSSAFFLLPLALIYFGTRLWRAPKPALAGAGLGLLVLATWFAFKATVLPSADPLTKFALAGDMGFGRPDASLFQLIAERYRGLTFESWLRTKIELGAYLFNPYPGGPSTGLVPTSPSLDGQQDWVGAFRAWDFYALTLGNLPILLLGVLGGFTAFAQGDVRSPRVRSIAWLMTVAIGCYALFLLATFLPLVAHQFSYDAVLAFALAGVAGLGTSKWPSRALAVLALATIAYVIPVWILAPLHNLVVFDVSAAIALLLVAVVALRSLIDVRWKEPSNRRLSIIVGLCLITFGGIGLAFEPGLLLRHIAPAYSSRVAPSARAGACLGQFDAAVQRRDGGWRAFGWAWDSGGRAASAVHLVGPDRTVIAQAQLGLERPDVAMVIKDHPDARAGWSADIATPVAGLTAVAILQDGSVCPLQGRPTWTPRGG